MENLGDLWVHVKSAIFSEALVLVPAEGLGFQAASACLAQSLLNGPESNERWGTESSGFPVFLLFFLPIGFMPNQSCNVTST
jgi:hypothetical protein